MKTCRFLQPLLLFLVVVASAACGSSKPSSKTPGLGGGRVTARHDYSSAWIYAVGELDAPSQADCAKAIKYIEAESKCVGAACKYGSNLIKDYGFACRKIATSAQRKRVTDQYAELVSRAQQAPSDCARQADDWLARGCGHDAACEPKLRQWAARCAEETKSPLAVRLLERMVEHSLHDPRPVKFDLRSCTEHAKKIADAAKCEKLFECEDAIPLVKEYIALCGEGKRGALPAAQAVQIYRIRSGAEKPNEPIPLAETKSPVLSLPGLLSFADGSGAVLKVCGEPVKDLTSYLDQRKACQNGEVTVLAPTETDNGLCLALQQLGHESDASFAYAHPDYFVEGEGEVRQKKAFEGLATLLVSLKKLGTDEFVDTFSRANQAYAAVLPASRQSERLYQALAPSDADLVTLFGQIGEKKARLVQKRLSDAELLGLVRRADKFVFADMSRKGSVNLGMSCELSELNLERALPRSFAAYKKGLSKLKGLMQKRKIVAKDEISAVRQTLSPYAQACSAARTRVADAQKQVARCVGSPESCSAEQRSSAASKLEVALSEWRAARVAEILAKVSNGQAEAPSAVCATW